MIIDPAVFKKIRKIVFSRKEPINKNVIWAFPIANDDDNFVYLVFYNGKWVPSDAFDNIFIYPEDGDISVFNNDVGYLTEHQSLDAYVNGGEYDNQTKMIYLKHDDNIISSIDATSFIKDGMVDTVTVSNGNLVITFNTDAGKEAITIPLTEIFNPANYYTKIETDELLLVKADAATTLAGYGITDAKIENGTITLGSNSITPLIEHQDISQKADIVTNAISGNFAGLDATGNLTDSGKDATDFAAASHTHTKSQITDMPTKLSEFTDDLGSSPTHTHSQYLDSSDIIGKADRVTNAISGNFASLDGNGNLTDSGHNPSDYLTSETQSDWNEADSSSAAYIANKPTIPIVNNATLTIQKNSATINTFTANANSDVTIDITVPTKTSELDNDAGFITYETNTATLQISDATNKKINTQETTDNYIQFTGGVDKFTVTDGSSSFDVSVTSSIDISNKEDKSNKVSSWTSTTTDTNYPSEKLVKVSLDTKVDKISGKGLSTNDYTTEEQTKLAGIASGAEVNQNAFSSIIVGNTTVAADNKTDSFTLVAGSNITLTPDGNNDSITIAASQPTVNNATLTIQKNSINVATFSANANSDVVADISVPTKTSELNNDSGYLTAVTWNDVTNKPETFTPEAHTHGNIANGGTLTDTAYAAAEGDYLVIRDAEDNKIETSTIAGTDVADAINKKHEHSTIILSTSAQIYDGINTIAMPANDPYTSARTPDSHTHGNIQNNGTLQTTEDITIANGDQLVVTDHTDSDKISRTNVTFDGSTTSKALSKKGTWETYLQSHQDISGKADKVSDATEDNFAGLDANGNLKDSGSKASDFVSSIGFSNNKLTWDKGGVAQTPLTIGYATNAGTATKLGSATVGATNKPIYLNSGTPTAVTSVGEAFLSWGGKNFSGSFGPVDAALVPQLGACRTMFAKKEGIIIEYSTDGGTTWVDYGASDSDKIGMFSFGGTTFTTGKNTVAGGFNTNYKLRVTLLTSAAQVYTEINKFVIYITTNGSTGCYCTIRCRTQQNYEDNVDTWVTRADQVPISGYSGYNVINITPTKTYGNTKSNQYGQWQFVFGYSSYDSTSTGLGLRIYSINGYGGMGWTTPSNMAKNGRLYTYDMSQNATFPANVSATTFYENGTALSSKYAPYNANGYLPLNGGTLANNGIGVLFIQRNNTSASAMIGFKKYSEGTTVETMGYIGMRSKDGPLKRWNDDASASYVIWDEGNDGSDSGLDADKLDGQHGSYYATASSVTTLQGYFTDGKAKKANADGDGNTISTTYLKVALKGAANGLAELDANGLVPSSQLPSYVDDVLEYASKSAFPATGTAGKIYVALDTNLTYRWSGSAYTEISPSLALGETSSTAYRGDRGKTAYTHATDASRLTTAKSSGFYKFATTAEGHIASVTAVEASDLTTLIGATTYAPYNATGYQVKVSKLGSTTKPLYTSAAGTFAECSTYAGGTAVTLNGTSKAASTASFYAPTTAGTAGQILTSTAGTPEWKTGELIHYVTSASGTAGSTASGSYNRTRWTGTCDGVTSLYTGLTATIKIPVAGVSRGVSLNINSLGEHPVLYNTSLLTTHYGVNTVITLTYDADQKASIYIDNVNTEITGCWKCNADYDSTNIYQLSRYYSQYKPTTALYRYMICLQKNETELIPVNAVSNSTATNKTLTTESFNPFGCILWYRSTTTVSAGSAIGTNTLYEKWLYDLRYSFNTAKNLTAGREVYIVAVPQSDGTAKLAASPITQTLPTTDGDNIYIFLGFAYDNYQVDLAVTHPVYWHKDGKLVPYSPLAATALEKANTALDSLFYKNIYIGVDSTYTNILDSGHYHESIARGKAIAFNTVSGYIWVVAPEEYTPVVAMSFLEVPMELNATETIGGVVCKIWRSELQYTSSFNLYLM